ncbi:MAG: CDP-alcohol phosphatidyltransferase family protein, partial [Candidatus Binatia bacterium]
VTDFLDGLAARLMKQQTALGAYLDPIADKLMVITSFIMLGLIGGIPTWLAVVVVSRDILIVMGYGIIYFLVDERLEVQPSFVGKCSTMSQLLTLGVALAMLHNPKIIDLLWRDFLIGATATATVLSGVQYLYRGFLWLQNKAPSIKRIS